MKICEFTRREVEYFRQECNFTKEQVALFDLRVKNIPLEECAEEMNVSVSTVYRINKAVKIKIEKVLNNKKCVESNVEGWNCGIASQSANDCCKDYKRVEQRTVKYKGVNAPIYDDSCEHMTTKICGRK